MPGEEEETVEEEGGEEEEGEEGEMQWPTLRLEIIRVPSALISVR